MPIFEYRCRKCGGVVERIEGQHDSPLRKCPSCGGRTERLMSPGAFILKGSGFYANDYAGKGNGKEGKGESCPASKGEAASPACAGCPKAQEQT